MRNAHKDKGAIGRCRGGDDIAVHRPSVGKNIALAYLPWEYARCGRALSVEYFGDVYPVDVAAGGYKALYDPENLKPRS